MLQPGKMMTAKDARSPAGQKLINDLMLGSDDFGTPNVYEDAADEVSVSPQRSLKQILGGGSYVPSRQSRTASSGTGRTVASALPPGTKPTQRPPPAQRDGPRDTSPGRPATAPATSSMLLPPQLPAPFPARSVTGGVSAILEPHLTSRHASAYPGTVTAVLHAVSSPAAIGVPRDTQRRPGTVPSDVYHHSAISPPQRGVSASESAPRSPMTPASAKSRDGSPQASVHSYSPSRTFGGSTGPTESGVAGHALSGAPALAEGIHGGALLAPVLDGPPRRAASHNSVTGPYGAVPSSAGGASVGFGRAAGDAFGRGGSPGRGEGGGAFHLPQAFGTLTPGGGSAAGRGSGGAAGAGGNFVPYLDRAHNSNPALACAVDAVARRAEAHKSLTRQRMLQSHQQAQHVQHMATGGKVTHGPLGHGLAGLNGGLFLYQPRSTDPYELRTDGVIPPVALGLAWDASPGVVAAAAAAAAAAVAAAAAKAEGVGSPSFALSTPSGMSSSPMRGNSVHWAGPSAEAGLLPAGWSPRPSSRVSAIRTRDVSNSIANAGGGGGEISSIGGPWGSTNAARRMVATVPSWIAVPPALASPDDLLESGTGDSDPILGSVGSASPARKNRRSKLRMPANAEEAASLAAEAQQAARSHLPPAIRRGYGGQLTPQTVADWETISEPNRRMMQEIDNVTNLVRGPPSRQRDGRDSRASRSSRSSSRRMQSPSPMEGLGGFRGSFRDPSPQVYGGHTSARSKRRYIRYSNDIFPELGLPSKPGTAATPGGGADVAPPSPSAVRGRGPGASLGSPSASVGSPFPGRTGSLAALHGETSRDKELLTGVVGLPFESSAGSLGADAWGSESSAPAGSEGGAAGARGGALGWGLRLPGTTPVGRASAAQPLHPLPTPSAAVAAVLAGGGAVAAAAATLPQWVDTQAAGAGLLVGPTSSSSGHFGAADEEQYGEYEYEYGTEAAAVPAASLPATPGAGRASAASTPHPPSTPSSHGALGARGVSLHGILTGTPSREPSFGPQEAGWAGSDGGAAQHGHQHGTSTPGETHYVHYDGEEELYHEHSFGSAVPPAYSAFAGGEAAEMALAASASGGKGRGSESSAARTPGPSVEHSLSLLPSGQLARGASSTSGGGSSSGALPGEASEGGRSVRSAAGGRPGSARGQAKARAERPLSASGHRSSGGGSRPGSARSGGGGGVEGSVAAESSVAAGEEGGERAVSQESSRVSLGGAGQQRPQRPQSALPGRLSRGSSASARSGGRSASACDAGREDAASGSVPAFSPGSSAAAGTTASADGAADLASTPVSGISDAAASADADAAAAGGGVLPAIHGVSPGPTHDGASTYGTYDGSSQSVGSSSSAAAAAAPQNPVLTPGAGYRVVTSVAAAALGSEDPREAARQAAQREVEEQLQRSAEHETKLKAARRASKALARASTSLPPLQPPPPPSPGPPGYSLIKVLQPQRLPRSSDASAGPVPGSLAVLAAPVPEPAEMEALSAAARALLAPQANRTSPQHHGPPGRRDIASPATARRPSLPSAASASAASAVASTQDGSSEAPSPAAAPAAPSPGGARRRSSTPPSSTLGRASYMVVQAATNTGRTAQMQDVWAA